jgi:hypothetical protein
MCGWSISRYHVVALVLVLLAITSRRADGLLPALEPGKKIAMSPRSNPSATFPTSPSRFAERNQQSKGESVVAEYNDDAFGLVFLSASFVARDVVFAAIFVLISAVSTIAVRQKIIPFSNKLPPLVAGMSLGLSILLNGLLSSPESLASNEGILFDWLADKSATAIQVELASCSVSIIYAFVVSPLLQKDYRS